MKVYIIGSGGHGKSTLVRAIQKLNQSSDTEYIITNTQTLIEINRQQIIDNMFNGDKLAEIFKVEENECLDNTSYKKKNKKVKNWERTIFYQK